MLRTLHCNYQFLKHDRPAVNEPDASPSFDNERKMKYFCGSPSRNQPSFLSLKWIKVKHWSGFQEQQNNYVVFDSRLHWVQISNCRGGFLYF